jgi:hypothetical protein
MHQSGQPMTLGKAAARQIELALIMDGALGD